MNLPFRAIISDLDGTLLNAEHRLGDFTITTLEKLATLGVDIFLATGRSFADVKHIIGKAKVKEAMLVTSNGARANNLVGELLAQHHLPEPLALELMQHIRFDPNNVCLNSYQGEKWFINREVEQLKKYHQDSGFMYEVVDFKHHHAKQTEKLFYIGRTPEHLLEIEQQIQARYADQVQLAYSTPQCLEVMAKNVCKANTLAELVKQKGYTLQECIAFGDGMNDIEMLAQAGKGCVMQNADPRLKAALPQNEVIGSNKEEAVAHYLCQQFKL